MKRISQSQSQSQSLKTLLTNGLNPQALKASLPNPKLTDETHALFINSGHSLHPYLSTTLISQFSKLGHFSRASKYLFETHNPNTVSFNALISIHWCDGFHRIGVKMGLLCGSSIHLNNAIMNMYCKCENKVAAFKTFDEIAEPDVVSWTARIRAACDGLEVLELFKVLHSGSLEMNEYTMINVLSVIAGPRLLTSSRQIQALCLKAAAAALDMATYP